MEKMKEKISKAKKNLLKEMEITGKFQISNCTEIKYILNYELIKENLKKIFCLDMRVKCFVK